MIKLRYWILVSVLILFVGAAADAHRPVYPKASAVHHANPKTLDCLSCHFDREKLKNFDTRTVEVVEIIVTPTCSACHVTNCSSFYTEE